MSRLFSAGSSRGGRWSAVPSPVLRRAQSRRAARLRPRSGPRSRAAVRHAFCRSLSSSSSLVDLTVMGFILRIPALSCSASASRAAPTSTAMASRRGLVGGFCSLPRASALRNTVAFASSRIARRTGRRALCRRGWAAGASCWALATSRIGSDDVRRLSLPSRSPALGHERDRSLETRLAIRARRAQRVSAADDGLEQLDWLGRGRQDGATVDLVVDRQRLLADQREPADGRGQLPGLPEAFRLDPGELGGEVLLLGLQLVRRAAAFSAWTARSRSASRRPRRSASRSVSRRLRPARGVPWRTNADRRCNRRVARRLPRDVRERRPARGDNPSGRARCSRRSSSHLHAAHARDLREHRVALVAQGLGDLLVSALGLALGRRWQCALCGVMLASTESVWTRRPPTSEGSVPPFIPR